MKSYDIAGYIYAADTWCEADIAPAIASKIDKTGNVVPGIMEYETTEEYLTRVQGFLGVRDRFDEYSFDSDHFPKVIFVDQAAEGDERCCECRERLLD